MLCENIDPIREALVMTLEGPVGPETNALKCDTPAARLILESPIFTYRQVLGLFRHATKWPSRVLDIYRGR